MAYATKDDLVKLYGQDILNRITDRDADDVPDYEAVDEALANASSRADSYLGAGGYALPLGLPIPVELKQAVVDIAVYFLANTGMSAMADYRVRYEDAIAFLKDIAARRANLSGGAVRVTDSQTDPITDVPSVVVGTVTRL